MCQSFRFRRFLFCKNIKEGEINMEVLTTTDSRNIMTTEGEEKEDDRNPINRRTIEDVGSREKHSGDSHPGGTGDQSARLHSEYQTERIQEDEQNGVGRILHSESGSGQTGSRESYSKRGAGLRSLESSDPIADIGERERLKPKDIILNEHSDIGFNAGAAAKFDANLEAIRTLKKIKSEDRNATSDEQSVLSKYSGFGDSAFGPAFPSNENYYYRDDSWKRRRDELKTLTTDEEFKAIEKSRLNAFYTTPEVIKFTWKTLEKLGVDKLKNPRILEPSAGSGRFFGYQPPEMAAKSQRIAVELDPMTGSILKQLYPNAETYVMGFEKAPIPKESIDVAISNVPFGNYPIHDSTFKKDRRKLTGSIHNYFFAKTLEELRPGGVLAFITSHQTLDAPTSKGIRQLLAKEADLVEAIRLPKNAFPDTQVVTDLIILKKRLPDEKPGDQSWVDTKEVTLQKKSRYGDNPLDVKLDVNKYFIDHPEKVLGVPSGNGSMNPRKSWEEGEYTVEPLPNISLDTQLKRSIEYTPSVAITDYAHKEKPRYEYSRATGTFEGAHLVGDDGIVYVKRNGVLAAANLSSIEESKVKKMLEIKDAAKAVIDIQVRNGSDSELAQRQKRLDDIYSNYVIDNGPLSTSSNIDLLDKDPDAPFLRALERNDVFKKAKNDLTEEDTRLIKILQGKIPLETKDINKIQMPIFRSRVIHGMEEKPVTDYSDAESIVKNQTGRLDFKLMADKLGKTENEVIDALSEKKLIFKNPIGDWEPADEYLTGDVREKLHKAEAAASARPKEYSRNVKALKVVQPKDIPAGQIGVRMGAPWIPASDINTFVKELLDAHEHYGRHRWGHEEEEAQRLQYFRYNSATGEWQLIYKPEANEGKLTEEFGTQRMPAYEIIDRVLNGKLVEVNDRNSDDKPVRNNKETIAAQEKATEIQRKFQDWIWKDPDRAERLAREYNERFNNYRPRSFDGSHQELPGISAKWAKWMHSHQKDAIWRVVQDRTALLAHEVGFGKTAVMVASGMELRRLGLAQKVMYVVPKATHAQFKEQFQDIYPFAKVLYPGEEDFTPSKRAEFISRAVTGDNDAVIVSDSQFKQIPVRPETEKKFLNDEIETIKEILLQEENANGGAHYKDAKSVPAKLKTQKEIQKSLERALVRMKDLDSKIKEKSDNTIYFEDIGIDQMYVDEADMYKNLHFTTRMGRIKGLPNSESERAWDMYKKTRYLQENKNNGVVFATGTPVANTIAEMYTNMRYLQEPMLEEKGLKHFDAWAKTFGETTETLEQTPTGQYKLTQRFSKFANAPELSNMWQTVADIRVADEVPEMVKQRPRIVNENGKTGRSVIAVKPDPALLEYMKRLSKRADELKNVDPKVDNMLKISSDARKASLDMRLVEANAPYNPDGKITVCCNKVTEIYKNTTKDKGTQLLFLDMGTPKAKEKDEDNRVPGEAEDEADTYEEQKLLKDVYGNIKAQLIANGIPEKEIAFIHDAKNDKQKEALFKKVNEGEVRVLIGSTGKMGAGVNVQTRAAALHHLDAPWRPRDIEQREGRIVRQGNIVYGPKKDAEGKVTDPGPGVKVYTYVTERSFDAYMWQAIEAKSKAIKAIMRRSSPPRAIEDIDSFTMSAGEAKAIASGNPDVLKSVTLKNSVTRLQMLRASDIDKKIRANEQLRTLPAKINNAKEDLAKLEKDARLVKDEDKFSMVINGKTITERPEAGDILMAAIKAAGNEKEIADYRGFKIKVLDQGPQVGYKLIAYNPETKREHISSSIAYSDLTAPGSISRIDNTIKSIPKTLEIRKDELKNAETNLKMYQVSAESPFEHEERLKTMEKELDRINRKLQGEQVEEDSPSDNYIDTDIPDDNEPAYRYSDEQVNPKAEIEAVKAEVEPVENQLEIKAPQPNIEKIIDKLDDSKIESMTPEQIKPKEPDKHDDTKELINSKEKTREVWVEQYGNDKKFEKWFETQLEMAKEKDIETDISQKPAKNPISQEISREPGTETVTKTKSNKPRQPRVKKIKQPETIKALPEAKPVLALPQNAPYGLSELKEINEQRRPQAQARDKNIKHHIVIQSTDPKVKNWVNHPGSMDIVGVDAPAGSEPTPKKERIKIVETHNITKPKSSKKISKTPKKEKEYRAIDLGAGVVRDRRGQHIKLD
jgi:N12 class adenine-specific DNA methylase